jgi:hypothetical protein
MILLKINGVEIGTPSADDREGDGDDSALHAFSDIST